MSIFIENHNYSIKCNTIRNSPFQCKVVSHGEFTADEEVVEVDPATHGPQLQANGRDSEKTVKRMVIFKIGRIGNSLWLPDALR